MLTLQQLQDNDNIVDLLEEDELSELSQQVITGYKIDENSRAEWKEIVDKAMDIAKQKMEPKNTPWPNASNIKYPLISQAAIQFAARVMPEIIQNDRVVKSSIVGNDPDGSKYRRGQRVAEYMSYQLVCESSDWEDGTDKLIQVLPVLGTVFKKTYYNSIEKRNVSELCVPDKVVVNYNIQSLDVARRITHILVMYKNDVVERQRKGIFSNKIDIDSLTPSMDKTDGSNTSIFTSDDSDYPIHLLEQHCYYDLDGDGYKEPYIITVHKDSGQILRIFNRFDSIEKNKEGEVVRIEPIHYFTDFHFIRSPDGGFYSIGFGSLLLPINAAINTLMNQLIDAGTLSNQQGGFLGRGLRLKNGEFKVKMGEWRVLDAASGTSLKENIFPMPVKDPSQTLFQLLGLLMQVGNSLSSATDVMQGQQPAQNVASNTVSQLVEQGSKVFTAINKRLYRSLKKEYNKLYELNCHHLTNKQYTEIMDDPEANVKQDFELYSMSVYPVADPSISSDQQRLQKAVVMHQLPTIDKRAADEYMLSTMQLEKSQIDRLLPPIDPKAPPPPEVQKIMAEIQLLQAQVGEISAAMTLKAEQNQLKQQEIQQSQIQIEANVQESAARVWKMQKDASHGDDKVVIAAGKLQSTELLKGAQFQHNSEKDTAKIAIEAANTHIKAAKVQVEANKVNKEHDVPVYSEEDIKHTAKLKGISIEKVKALLKLKETK